VDYPVGDGPWSVFACDLDADGDLDIAAGNEFSDNVSILLNNGDGTFASHTDYAAGDAAISVFAADLDHDGDLDLASANYLSDNISVLINFTAGCDYVVGDINGSDSYNGLDITYGVAFFKGGGAPLCENCPLDDCNSWYYCGDVNGSCSYNGLDITYGVAYFKGGPGPIYCDDCAPLE
jgi:hypothetical protein